AIKRVLNAIGSLLICYTADGACETRRMVRTLVKQGHTPI
ncbi:hypothetical protein LCGC14_2995180, partial [marine sediment metagenome]